MRLSFQALGPPFRLMALGVLSAIALLAATPRAGAAGVEVQDSPLYAAMLEDAIADLREPVAATSPWRIGDAGQAVADLVFGTPAHAQAAAATVFNEKATVCKNGGKNVTQCDKSSGERQQCTKTVHSQKKTDCNGAADKTVCKAAGTRCPGNGNANPCATAAPPALTTCTDPAEPTLCNGEATRCQAGDRNECSTFSGAAKTACKPGADHATLCSGEDTGCSAKGKNVCKTAKPNDKTSCMGHPQITMCKDAGTICTGDDINEGCDYRNVAMSTTRLMGNDQNVLVSVHTEPGFFSVDPLAQLQFLPGGPIMAEEAQVWDDDEAHFYLNVPSPPPGPGQFTSHQAIAFGGTGMVETPGLFVDDQDFVPAIDSAGFAFLIAIMAAVGALALRRRREA